MPFESVPEKLGRQFARARHADGYVGYTAESARQLALRAGVRQVRVISLDDDVVRMHQDHRSQTRLNLLVLHGTVVRAAFF